MTGPARPAEELRHQDVVLRRWRSTPAEVQIACRIVVDALDHLAPWMPWATPGYSMPDAEAFLQRCEDDWESGKAFSFAIVAPDGEMVGSCGLMDTQGPGTLEAGYWLLPSYTGRGLATMATVALIDEAFRMGVDRVVIGHDAANTRSGAVPARLGFTEVARRPIAAETGGTAHSGIGVLWELTRT